MAFKIDHVTAAGEKLNDENVAKMISLISAKNSDAAEMMVFSCGAGEDLNRPKRNFGVHFTFLFSMK